MSNNECIYHNMSTKLYIIRCICKKIIAKLPKYAHKKTISRQNEHSRKNKESLFRQKRLTPLYAITKRRTWKRPLKPVLT